MAGLAEGLSSQQVPFSLTLCQCWCFCLNQSLLLFNMYLVDQFIKGYDKGYRWKADEEYAGGDLGGS